MTIRIRMLGEFSFQLGETTLSDTSNRAHKVWTFLAYLILNRDRVISHQKLIDLLWGSESDSENPENALRITVHRARTFLDTLEKGLGRTLILQKDGGYVWNTSIDTFFDCDRLEELCQFDGLDTDTQLANALAALELCRGEFLPKLSTEVWVIPISTHCHNLYLLATEVAAKLLSERNRLEEAANICRKAIADEPYHEPLHQTLMQLLAAMKRPKEVAEIYEALSKRLFDDFGIRPREETREIYRAAAHAIDDRTIEIDEVLEDLHEQDAPPGALVCDYDYFRILCHAESRSMERNGNATHIALFSISAMPDKPLSKRSINRIMDQFGEQLRQNLRRGDTISRCSVSQYIIMLPKANYENSNMVCRRILAAFQRTHPHAKATINYMVQPLTPSFIIP